MCAKTNPQIKHKRGITMAEKNELKNIMKNNNIWILTTINDETTSGLIQQLTEYINSIKKVSLPCKIYAPYEKIPSTTPVLNVYINSCGGKTLVLQSILSMFHQASAMGAIIKTHNIARADSSASMIAVSGTKGYRYMAEDAYNTIHFGNIGNNINHINEIEFSNQYVKNWYTKTQNLYLRTTNLTKKELNKYYNVEQSGFLTAEQCLEKGICDWVITNDDRWVNCVSELKNKAR